MAGIAGFFHPLKSGFDPALLERMLTCLSHHPSDVVRTLPGLTAFKAGCAGRPISQRLVQQSSGQLSLFIYGELSTTDESLHSLLNLYEREGVTVLARVNGCFVGLLVDTQANRVTLFNDRYGLRRIYWHQDKDSFFFSSEAKSLLAVLPHTRCLDPRGVAEWLSCGCVMQNRTLFDGIRLLPPGSAWTFAEDGSVTQERYFNPEVWESQPTLSPNAFYDRLKEMFPRVLGPYVDSAPSVAMSLTGGLDGRMIMSWVGGPSRKLPCYTFNGPVRDCADVKVAREVAGVCGQLHQTIPLADDFFANFPSLAAQSVYVSDGAMDVTGAAELYFNRLAADIAPIRLTGNYGSEILRRYVAFRPRMLSSEVFSPGTLLNAASAAQTYSSEASCHRLSFIAFKQVPWHHYARFSVEQSQLTVRSPFLDNELVALAFQCPAAAATSLEPSLRLIADGNPALAQIPTDRGVTYPPRRFQNRVIRPLHEFLARAEYAYDYGMPNWLARIDRHLGGLHLERLFLGRQKFCHFRSWYRQELAGFVRDTLLDPRSRQRTYLNDGAIEPLVTAHIRGTRNATTEIHKLLSLELLQRQLLN